MKPRYDGFFYGFAFLFLLDAYLTIEALRYAGAVELNPFIRDVLASGSGALWAAKLVSLGLLVLMALIIPAAWARLFWRGAAGAYALLALWNLASLFTLMVV